MQQEPITPRAPRSSRSSRLYLVGVGALAAGVIVALIASDLPWTVVRSGPPAPLVPANLRVPLRVPAAPLTEPVAPTPPPTERAVAPESPVPRRAANSDPCRFGFPVAAATRILV
jgi:hypothetical protein